MTEHESYYKIRRGVSESQKRYIQLVRDCFRVFSFGQNKWIDYEPTEWQQEFHAYSLNALHKDFWKDRLVVKGRGISFSTSAMIDMIMSAQKFKQITIPIVTHRQDNALDLIRTAQNLIDNAKVDFDVERPFTKKEIIFKSTGSIIRAYPSANDNAVRQLRTFTGLFDEITFYRDIKGVLDAAESIINEGGQITMGSTVYDRNNYFWELYQQQKQLKNKYVFSLPLFDPDKFKPNENIIIQVEGGLKPLVWWHDIKKLEDKRQRDYASFLRENMCQPSDENVNFISIEKIMRNVDEELSNYDNYKTDNMLFGGLDVASYGDYIAIVIFEQTPFGMVMRHCRAIKGMELPDLQKLIETEYLGTWNFTKFRVDMTGMGTQIAQYLKKKFGGIVEMIHFGQTVEGAIIGGSAKVQAGGQIKQSIREKMAYNLRYLLEDDKIKILNDPLLIKHLNSWSWDLKKCLSTDGHGDLFWACGLACLPLSYKRVEERFIVKTEGVEQKIIPPKVNVEWQV